jgi:hypothetical protein
VFSVKYNEETQLDFTPITAGCHLAASMLRDGRLRLLALRRCYRWHLI